VQLRQIQILHCIRQAEIGGDSQFADGFQVADQLRDEHKHLYDALCTYPIEYIDWGVGAAGHREDYRFQMAAMWRTIEYDHFL
jgi:hypothetical protein